MRLDKKIIKWLKKIFWTGIATVFPVFITIYIFYLVFRLADNLIGKHIQAYLLAQYNFTIPGLGLIMLFIIIIIFGIFSRFVFGKWFSSILDRFFKKVPLVANVYPSAKKLSDFLFSSEGRDKNFQKVVLVEFPTPGSWSIGFITNENLSDLEIDLPEKYVCVFVPLAPTPFSGFVYWAPKEKVKELKMGIDKAVAFILSGGVVTK
jgi:uncharacterized membrane protein